MTVTFAPTQCVIFSNHDLTNICGEKQIIQEKIGGSNHNSAGPSSTAENLLVNKVSMNKFI